jgi:hypothetical protein
VYVSRMNCYNSPFLDSIERSVEVMVSSGLMVNGSLEHVKVPPPINMNTQLNQPVSKATSEVGGDQIIH